MIVSEFLNGEHELIQIRRVTDGDFKGSLILCIVDNNHRGAVAPHLLDRETRDWLREQLDKLDEAECSPDTRAYKH